MYAKVSPAHIHSYQRLPDSALSQRAPLPAVHVKGPLDSVLPAQQVNWLSMAPVSLPLPVQPGHFSRTRLRLAVRAIQTVQRAQKARTNALPASKRDQC